MTGSTGAARPDEVRLQSLTAALELLNRFATANEIGVTEAAAHLGVAKSTAHRLLTTLAAFGFVERTVNRRYRLGVRIYELGEIAVSRLGLHEVALPVLEELRNVCGETVHVAIPDGAEVVYIARMESHQGLRFSSRVGRRMPAHATSSGKAIAAFNPEVAKAVVSSPLLRLTGRTIVSPQLFLRALADARTAGYACSTEEAEVGLSSVAAPVLDADGVAIAAVSVAGPSERILHDERLTAGRVKAAAARLAKDHAAWLPPRRRSALRASRPTDDRR
ncbi:MAG: IclR family transcriptional regulator [Acidimicrobiia bacterium]